MRSMRFGIDTQREFSLLDGETRRNPIQPIHGQPALVQIGNRRLMARVEVAPRPSDEARHAFVRGWAKRQNHECAATLAGEFCGHKV